MLRIVATGLILIFSANPLALAADKGPVQVQWGSLSALIEGREFEGDLTNGVRIRGRGAKISGRELQTSVIQTTDATLVPLGPNRLDSQLFETIKIHRRAIGRRTAFGVLLGLAGASIAYLAVSSETIGESSSTGLAVAATSAGAVSGALLGGRRPLFVRVIQ